jgi:hypothetical protein
MNDLEYFYKNLWVASGIPKKYTIRMFRKMKIKKLFNL